MKTALNIRNNNNHPNRSITIKAAALIIVTLVTLLFKTNSTDSTRVGKNEFSTYIVLSR